MVDAPTRQALRVEVALFSVHLHHRVADRRAGGKGDSVAWMVFMEIAALHVQVESAFTSGGLNSGYPFHFGGSFEVFETHVLFTNDEVIDGQVVEHKAIILFVLGKQVFQLRLACGLLLLDGFDQVPLGSCRTLTRVVDKERVVLLDLFLQEPLLVVP